jgi:hypothetical protein
MKYSEVAALAKVLEQELNTGTLFKFTDPRVALKLHETDQANVVRLWVKNITDGSSLKMTITFNGKKNLINQVVKAVNDYPELCTKVDAIVYEANGKQVDIAVRKYGFYIKMANKERYVPDLASAITFVSNG